LTQPFVIVVLAALINFKPLRLTALADAAVVSFIDAVVSHPSRHFAPSLCCAAQLRYARV
jgi:hypothetical protein